MLLMGKSTISMAIFNSKLLVYQRVNSSVNSMVYGRYMMIIDDICRHQKKRWFQLTVWCKMCKLLWFMVIMGPQSNRVQLRYKWLNSVVYGRYMMMYVDISN